MKNHTVRVYPSKENLPREDQLAWKFAQVAVDPAPRADVGFPPSPDSDGVRQVALGNEERLPDKFKAS